MLRKFCVTIKPLSRYWHVDLAPGRDVLTSATECLLYVNPFLTSVTQMPQRLELALLGRLQFSDEIAFCRTKGPLLH
jgi:hypothetical protein